jgi:hypothetical protein
LGKKEVEKREREREREVLMFGKMKKNKYNKVKT